MSEVNNDFRKSLVNSKKVAESYVVLCMYKNTEIYFDNSLSKDDFDTPVWKYYFSMGEKAIENGNKVLDDITMGVTISTSDALEKAYNNFGGYDTIANGIEFVQIENFEAYYKDVKKYNALIRLHDLGFPIQDNFKSYNTMSSESIQEALETVLDAVFGDIEVDEPLEDLSEGLMQVVMDAHNGLNNGFPYVSSLLTQFTNGMSLGNITILSANSGVGKTFITVAQILPNMIKFEEKLTILANEEDANKWKRSIITYVANNVYDGNFDKSRFNQGSFTEEEMTLLKKSVKWLEDKMKKGIITFVNFSQFSMDKAIKAIKKQRSVNKVKYFIIDTLKLDSTGNLNQDAVAWLQLQQNMVKLFDAIKIRKSGSGEEKNGVSVFVTYQLGKSAIMQRYLSQNSLGVSKNVVDVASTLILVRKALDSEKKGGKNEVKVKTRKGKIIELDPDKDYFIVFLGKNRDGGTHLQLVYEVNLALNTMEEIGTCKIEQDF